MTRLLWSALAVIVMGSAGCDDSRGGARFDAGVDGGADNTYGFCDPDQACTDSRDRCYTVTLEPAGTSGNFCSSGCAADAECESNFGYTGGCYNLQSTTFLCYQRCTVDSDCYASSVCIDIQLSTGGVDYVCVPDN